MRSIVILNLLVLGFLIQAEAQTDRSTDRREEMKKEMDAFYKELSVTDEQMLAIEEEQKRHSSELIELREKTSGRGMSDERKEIQDTHMANMKEILTADQYAEWEEKITELRRHVRSRHRKHQRPN